MVALQMPRLPQCIGRGGSFFCFPDQAFRHHGAERDSRHEKEDSIYGQIFIEKSSDRRHDDDHRWVERGTGRITFLFHAAGNQVGIPGRVGETVNDGDGADRQGEQQVEQKMKGVPSYPEPHACINNRQHKIHSQNPLFFSSYCKSAVL